LHFLPPVQEAIVLFESFRIKDVQFANRMLRSSMGGRTAYYDGTVSPAWVHFEKRFAEGGVAGIISPTISINEARMSPLEYPALHDNRFIGPLGDAIREIRAARPGSDGCRYIIQIGDTGGHTHTSLRPQQADRVSSSATFDMLFGYHTATRPMSIVEIRSTVTDFRKAAGRAAAAGCDGIEVTASKGYLIHQFLNPAVNRRTDEYGGSIENRFRLLREVVTAVREEIGDRFLFGVRLSASDYCRRPFNIRFPLTFPFPSWREFRHGNELAETTYYARKLEELGVDYLHIDAGFGFPNPAGSPGAYPDEGFRTFVNASRFLSRKANVRATIFNLTPAAIRRRLFAYNWYFKAAANADFAALIRRTVGIPVIANGGFQERNIIDQALATGKCDMVAVARPLLANPDLLKQLAAANKPARPCSYCTLCCSHTAVFPLGCYDQRRFETKEAMMNQVLAWCSPNAPFSTKDGKAPATVT
jgi:2,4-dienoyl-CoA reductase-like NADH-dependent reductase (Old Yellow Enzyme family)